MARAYLFRDPDVSAACVTAGQLSLPHELDVGQRARLQADVPAEGVRLEPRGDGRLVSPHRPWDERSSVHRRRQSATVVEPRDVVLSSVGHDGPHPAPLARRERIALKLDPHAYAIALGLGDPGKAGRWRGCWGRVWGHGR